MNEPAIALIALDLDRTLFQSDGSVSARTLSAIDACRRKGLHIAIATARPFASVQTFLPEALHRDVPWVCGSGASIYENEQCVYADLIAVDVAQRVVELLYAIDADFIFSLEMNGKLYVNRPVPGRITPHEACDLRQIVTDPVAKFLINLDDPYQDKIQLPDLPPAARSS